MIKSTYKKGTDQVKLTFSVPSHGQDGVVAVVGDFNAWDPYATPLRKKGAQRTASVTVETGRRYRFRYLRGDGQWFNDEAADNYEIGEMGAENSVIDLTDHSLVGGPGSS